MQNGLGKKGLGKKGLGKDDLGKKAFAPHACAGEAYLCAGVRDLLRPMRGACVSTRGTKSLGGTPSGSVWGRGGIEADQGDGDT
jgi:hypothetical protein